MPTILAVSTAALMGVVGTTTVFGAPYPRVSTLHAFSAEANYMSLPGYLRYLVHQQDGHWLRYGMASRIVRQERGG